MPLSRDRRTHQMQEFGWGLSLSHCPGDGLEEREGGLAGRAPPMIPPFLAPKAPEMFFTLKSCCAEGAEENFASNSGRGGGGVQGRGGGLLLLLPAVLIHPCIAPNSVFDSTL